MNRPLTILQQIRQNHAIEHAAMHIIARRVPGLFLVAHSDWAGFTVWGQVETPALIDAVAEGLHRLRDGEASLAVHQRCGTNLAVPLGLTGGLLLASASLPRDWRLTRSAMVLLAGFAFGIRKPLSRAVQNYMTTTTALQRVRIKSVQRSSSCGIVVHRIRLSS